MPRHRYPLAETADRRAREANRLKGRTVVRGFDGLVRDEVSRFSIPPVAASRPLGRPRHSYLP